MRLSENGLKWIEKLEWPILVILLTLLGAVLIFKVYLFHPNDYSYSFGGDAFAIYYDMVYHVQYDHGTMFHGMNYPFGEYIFMTDAEGALSTILQWINHHVTHIADVVPGIVHSLNLYLLPLCSLFLFYIFRYFDVRPLLACVFAVLITFLSPHILRFGGHFGLAYPFLIPMVMWWFLRKWKINRPEKRDIAVFITLVFFTYNNPYVGFTASGFLLAAGFIMLLISIRNRLYRNLALMLLAMGFIANVIPYITFHLNDPFTDRLKQQWGFFYYHADFNGLLYPPNSLLNNILVASHVNIKHIEFERWINIGIVNCLLLLGILVSLIIRYSRKETRINFPVLKKENLVILGASTILFIYAANVAIMPLPVDWMEDHLGPLLMFKAVARIAWPFYFALSISAIIYLDGLLKKINFPILSWLLASILAITWIMEIKSYVGLRYKEIFNANFLHPDHQRELQKTLAAYNIDTVHYQAILALPKMMAWNDQFISDIQWSTQFFSMRTSAVTGLPLISAMLSRISNSHCTEAIQMLSSPLIERELIQKFPNKKDILVLLGGDPPPLSVGEQYVIDISKPVMISKDFSLYKLPVDSLARLPQVEQARAMYRNTQFIPTEYIHIDFDSLPSESRFYGDGASRLPAGQTILVNQPLPASLDSQFIFSAWTHVGNDRPSAGYWFVSVIDSTGHPFFNAQIETRRSYDIQGQWVRSEVILPAPRGSSIWAMIETQNEILVDEILVYPAHSSPVIDIPDEKTFLFKGYKVKK